MEINRVFLILTKIIATIEITVITIVIFGMLTICYVCTV